MEVTIVAAIIGLSEIFKKWGVNPQFIPIINIVLGLISCLVLMDLNLEELVIRGFFIGLASSGLYDCAKIVGKTGVEDNDNN